MLKFGIYFCLTIPFWIYNPVVYGYYPHLWPLNPHQIPLFSGYVPLYSYDLTIEPDENPFKPPWNPHRNLIFHGGLPRHFPSTHLWSRISWKSTWRPSFAASRFMTSMKSLVAVCMAGNPWLFNALPCWNMLKPWISQEEMIEMG